MFSDLEIISQEEFDEFNELEVEIDTIERIKSRGKNLYSNINYIKGVDELLNEFDDRYEEDEDMEY